MNITNQKILDKSFLSTFLLFAFVYAIQAQNTMGLQIGSNQEIVFGEDIESPGSKMMWIASKGAFRAGLFAQNNSHLYSQIGQNSIALGAHNLATELSSVAIGYWNTSLGRSSLAIGESTRATGAYAVSMGYHTIASGQSSFAIGERVDASGKYSTAIGKEVSTNLRQGSIIIGDSNPTNLGYLHVGLDDQFMARFANGYEFRTSNGGVTWIGVKVQPGGNAWESISDVNRKENFEKLNDIETLNKLASINYSSWNYIGQKPEKQRHYGIMAQEFHRLFGQDKFGIIGTDTTVNPIDMIGITMSAIKGASEKIQFTNEKVSQMQNENEDLKRKVADLESRMEKLLLLEKRLNQIEKRISTN